MDERVEGYLSKWTNFLSVRSRLSFLNSFLKEIAFNIGWQSRWFVLEDGVLYYYKSKEEVQAGCKGSVNVAMCEIIADQVYPNRMEVWIPGEKHFYLQCSSAQERQRWLMALGSAKAKYNSTAAMNNTFNGILFIFLVTVLMCKCFVDSIMKNALNAKSKELKLFCSILRHHLDAMLKSLDKNESISPQQFIKEAKKIYKTCMRCSGITEDWLFVMNRCNLALSLNENDWKNDDDEDNNNDLVDDELSHQDTQSVRSCSSSDSSSESSDNGSTAELLLESPPKIIADMLLNLAECLNVENPTTMKNFQTATETLITILDAFNFGAMAGIKMDLLRTIERTALFCDENMSSLKQVLEAEAKLVVGANLFEHLIGYFKTCALFLLKCFRNLCSESTNSLQCLKKAFRDTFTAPHFKLINYVIETTTPHVASADEIALALCNEEDKPILEDNVDNSLLLRFFTHFPFLNSASMLHAGHCSFAHCLTAVPVVCKYFFYQFHCKVKCRLLSFVFTSSILQTNVLFGLVYLGRSSCCSCRFLLIFDNWLFFRSSDWSMLVGNAKCAESVGVGAQENCMR
ncbi:Pleckstrin homology domain-containing family A member 3 [Trichinella spiralis]|uniref:Pleckstrin homology domain-containing family A member 3 n=1 Tax=Trichinella spiralis TaxID=6334 RepID=A0A0V1B927_TRISP|nr:Pleckstrin homology domain-containing family A member 3 [Trichinella spiralis]